MRTIAIISFVSLAMSSGALARRMYARMTGAKKPPAPVTLPPVNGSRIDNAHVAFDSLCFSKQTTSTRLCAPLATRSRLPARRNRRCAVAAPARR